MPDILMKIYVISLAGATERRESCKKALEELHLDYEFFDAVDGRNISDEDLALCKISDQNIFTLSNGRQIMFEDRLSPGEQGCALSHLKLYQHILDKGDEMAVIMEDDCILKPPFIEALDNIDVIKEHWDIINFSAHKGFRYNPLAPKYRFGSNPEQYFFRVGFRQHWLNLLFNSKRFMTGTVLYVVKPETCRKLIEFGYPVCVTADVVTGFIAANHMSIFRPFPAYKHYSDYEGFESEIGVRARHRMVRL